MLRSGARAHRHGHILSYDGQQADGRSHHRSGARHMRDVRGHPRHDEEIRPPESGRRRQVRRRAREAVRRRQGDGGEAARGGREHLAGRGREDHRRSARQGALGRPFPRGDGGGGRRRDRRRGGREQGRSPPQKPPIPLPEAGRKKTRDPRSRPLLICANAHFIRRKTGIKCPFCHMRTYSHPAFRLPIYGHMCGHRSDICPLGHITARTKNARAL